MMMRYKQCIFLYYRIRTENSLPVFCEKCESKAIYHKHCTWKTDRNIYHRCAMWCAYKIVRTLFPYTSVSFSAQCIPYSKRKLISTVIRQFSKQCEVINISYYGTAYGREIGNFLAAARPEPIYIVQGEGCWRICLLVVCTLGVGTQGGVGRISRYCETVQVRSHAAHIKSLKSV